MNSRLAAALPALPALVLLTATAGAADLTVSSGQSIGPVLAGAASGDRVLVEAGSYFEHLTLVDGVQLLGGYDSSFSDASRNPQANPTVIHGSGTGAPISATGVGATTVVDGFILTGAGGSPGAAVVLNGASPAISNNEIYGNRRVGASGGIYAFGGSAARIVGNHIHDNSAAGSGGAMRIENSPVTIVGNTIEDCVAPDTGGALYVFQSAVGCSSNVFRDNMAGQGGGAICLQQVPPGTWLYDNTFENCSAPFGGAIWLKDDAFATFELGVYDGCSGTRGGAVAVTNWSDLNSINDRYMDCSADIQGGGLYGLASFIDVFGTDASSPASTASFTDCTAGDGLNGKGGGLGVSRCTGTVDKVRFTRCDSDSMGGGAYFLHSDYVISECLAEDCNSSDGGGLAIHAATSDLFRSSFVQNCTVYGCGANGTSDPAGGILLAAMGTRRVATLGGTIVSHTVAGVAIRCKRGGAETQTGLPVISCTTIHNATSNPAVTVSGPQCVSAVSSSGSNQDGVDPLYCDANPTNYTLKLCSPAVATNCAQGTAGRLNRGVAPDGTECPCSPASLTETSWGKIKSMYR